MTAKDERFLKCISDNVETILSLQEQLNKINLTIDLIYKTLKNGSKMKDLNNLKNGSILFKI